MVGGYFHDMAIVLSNLEPALVRGGSAWVVTGDSKYGSTHIPTGTILAELARSSGWTVQLIEPWRSMRASAQQGGQRELTEQLMVLASPSTTLSDLRAP